MPQDSVEHRHMFSGLHNVLDNHTSSISSPSGTCCMPHVYFSVCIGRYTEDPLIQGRLSEQAGPGDWACSSNWYCKSSYFEFFMRNTWRSSARWTYSARSTLDLSSLQASTCQSSIACHTVHPHAAHGIDHVHSSNQMTGFLGCFSTRGNIMGFSRSRKFSELYKIRPHSKKRFERPITAQIPGIVLDPCFYHHYGKWSTIMLSLARQLSDKPKCLLEAC